MEKLTPIKAIRAKCLDCCAYQPAEVRLCCSKTCPLIFYRMGKRPKIEEKTSDNPSKNGKNEVLNEDLKQKGEK